MNVKRSVFKSAKRRDRAARWLITAGGLSIIVSVLTILVMIFKVALPLFYPASLNEIALADADGPPQGEALAVGADDFNASLYWIGRDGKLHFVGAEGGGTSETLDLHAGGTVALPLLAAEAHGGNRYTLLWQDGSASLVGINFRLGSNAAGARNVERSIARLAEFPAPGGKDAGVAPRLALARAGEEGSFTRVTWSEDDALRIDRNQETEDFLGNKTSESTQGSIADKLPGAIAALALDGAARNLYAGTQNGFLLHWDLSDAAAPKLVQQVQAFADGRAITALGMVLGDVSIAVGDAQGGYSTWTQAPERAGSEKKALQKIHDLHPHAAAIVSIAASQRSKTLLSVDAKGGVALDHMTSERRLASLEVGASLAAFNGRGDGVAALGADGAPRLWHLDNPHPEVSFKTLFGKVWYEKYPEPAYVWQSSSASDDFEPKLSLVPLIFGTLKGTLYAMLFSVPLACFGALYSSQFMHPRYRLIVKPTVEIMAAVPSVVIGFLAALWLAPIIKTFLPAFALFVFVAPAIIIAGVAAYHQRRRRANRPLPAVGREFLALLPILALAFYCCTLAGPSLERAFFHGDVAQWFWDSFKIRYDQRNSIVIGFGLGFAVIPIIFTIADDALNNVPGNLIAGSLALGASRWQTAWRVALPSASPGIFAAVMIGFGRAIGETMIVLMATGNTPIMSMSLFNGMRTLSANIAVEIPEAPFDGTLYRVLFLTAVLLFASTFLVNTLAEVVRIRLRRKYGRL